MSNERTIERGLPLYRQAYEVLKDKIIRGEYRPGSVMSETVLAESLGVSRTPIREAIRQLERDGLVTVERFEILIPKPNREEFHELYLCRAALEQLVAERAALHAREEDVDAMEAALQRAEKALESNDQPGVLYNNTQFHDHMVAAAGIVRLSRLMEELRGPILLARRLVLSSGEAGERDILKEHQELLACIHDHNPVLAQEWMRRHMENDIQRGFAQFDAAQKLD